MIGECLGPFRIESVLGVGGMGEVYRATDTRLGRSVALKTLPEAVASDAAWRQRFEREARAISSLSHPHICSLYDFGRDGDTAYLVMELVDGHTLAERLGKGALALPEALRVAAQLADALGAAHRQGIVHRDVKPGNVMLTRAGVKLLDFGLARLRRDDPEAEAAQPALPTAAAPLTEAGALLGTYQYMAPEQAEGRETDARSDIFAFGSVLYEMLTGRPAFAGASRAALAGAILHTEPPPLVEHQPLAPPALERLLRKCLAKDPEARWQSAHDLRDELQWVAEQVARPAEHAARTLRGRWAARAGWVAAAGLALLVVLVWATGRGAGTPAMRPATWAAIPPPDGTTALGPPLLAPDGRSLVFGMRSATGEQRLWVHALGAGEARPLAGTELAAAPFFSADGRSLGFFARGALRVLDLEGGRMLTLADLTLADGINTSFAGGTWSRGGDILFSPGLDSGLRRVAATGGAALEVTVLDRDREDVAHSWPHFLPDGRHFVFMVRGGREPGIYLGSLDAGELLRLVALNALSATGVAYAPSGHILYLVDGTLVAHPFDANRLQITGEPVTVAEGLRFTPEAAFFAVSAEGTLAFGEDTGWSVWQPVWLDRAGGELGPAGPPGPYWDAELTRRPSLSPDGRRLAVARREAKGQPEVWILDVQRGTALPFARGAFNASPIWSPPGDRLAWSRITDTLPQIYVKGVESTADGELLTTQPPFFDRWPTDWSASGRYLLYEQQTYRTTGWDLHVLDLEAGEFASRPYLATAGREVSAVLSPDERWVAYAAGLSGRQEIYVSTFPEHGRRWQISTGGGSLPLWSRHGREIVYAAPQRAVMAVTIEEDGDELVISEPEMLFRLDGSGFLAVTPDGERFVGLRKVADPPLRPFTLVLDWTQALR